MMSQFDTYDKAREYYDSMVKDRRRYGELSTEIKKIKEDLDRGIVPPEDREMARRELDTYTWIRDRINSSLPEKYQVSTIKQLSGKIRDFGPQLEMQFEQEVQSQSQQGQSQGEQQSTESVLRQIAKNITEYSKFSEYHMEQAQIALEARSYKLLDEEYNKALHCTQEASRQIEYSKQLLQQEMGRDPQAHKGIQNENVLHPEIKRSLDTEQLRNMTRIERLETLKRQFLERKEQDREPERTRE